VLSCDTFKGLACSRTCNACMTVCHLVCSCPKNELKICPASENGPKHRSITGNSLHVLQLLSDATPEQSQTNPHRHILFTGYTPNSLTHLAHLCWIVGQQVQGPCEDRAGGLMPSHQHRHQIIPQLICRNLVSRGNKEAQDAGVALIDVPLFKTCL